MNQRSGFEYFKLLLKGMLMGAADAVPGVSGGTVAFITGIYEELIHSIRQCDLSAVKKLFSEGFGAFWAHINGNFLITLILGILISVASLARLVLYLLDHQPIPLWSFFFGLILASTWIVGRHIKRWSANRLAGFGMGVVIAFLITSLSPGSIESTPLIVLLSGMVAICAMILPGISGSFILLLLGMYSVILTAVKEVELITLGIFLLGCVIGILSFSRLLSWAFNHFREMTLAILGGFLLGSLNKVWPWKYTLSYRINSKGEEVPLVQQNVLPDIFHDLTGGDPQLLIALAMAAIGLIAVVVLERRAE